MTTNELIESLSKWPNCKIQFIIFDIDGNIKKNLIPSTSDNHIILEHKNNNGENIGVVLGFNE